MTQSELSGGDHLDARMRRTLRVRHRSMTGLYEEIVRLHGPVLPSGNPGAAFVPVETTCPEGARGTIFSFAGLRTEAGEARPEFAGTLADCGYAQVFVKDFAQVWYQHGLTGLGSNRRQVFEALREHFATYPRPWICIGNSAGGYAALYGGAVMGADRVVAFAPQTQISHDVFVKFAGEAPRLRDFSVSDPENDLLNVLPGLPKSHATVIYGRRNLTDTDQATRLRWLPGIRLAGLPSGSHAIAGFLRQNNLLLSAILEK